MYFYFLVKLCVCVGCEILVNVFWHSHDDHMVFSFNLNIINCGDGFSDTLILFVVQLTLFSY